MLKNLYFFGVLLIVFFVIMYFISRRKLKKNKLDSIGDINYLIIKFKLDKKKINYKKLILIDSAINAFIISFTCTIISVLPIDLIWQLLIGFVILFLMIFLIYEIVGRICIKKGWQQNGRNGSQKNRK